MTLLAVSFTSLVHAQFWIGVGILTAIYGTFSVGLQVNIGYTGIYNFGQIAFMAIGAYAMGVLVVKAHWSFWAALPMASAIAVAFGVALGFASLRLRAQYFAIVTIAFAEIARNVIQNIKLTGGAAGLLGFSSQWQTIASSVVRRLQLGPSYALVPLLVVAWLAFIAAVLITRMLMRTPWGRVLRGIREDEDAARALGKNTLFFKVQSLGVAALLGSISGWLLALYLSYLSPDEFTSDPTFIAYAMLVVGGLGSFVGIVFGALLIEVLLQATLFVHLPLSDTQVASLRYIIVGLVLILGMAFRPQGVLGKREEMVLRG